MILAATIAAGVFGLNTRLTLSYQIVAFLLSLIIISFLSNLIWRGSFRITRILPEHGTSGTDMKYKVQIRNNSSSSYSGLTLMDSLLSTNPSYREFRTARDILDQKRNFFDRLVGYPRLVTLIHKMRGANIEHENIDLIREKETCEKEITIRPLRRGYIYFKDTIIARSDPFGLVRKLKRYNLRDKLLVLPKYYKFPDIAMPGKRKYQHGGMSLASSVGDSEEFFSLRDYRPGDPLKAIHWRSYAKKGEPVIKEYQDEYFSRLGLVLDTFIENQPDYVFEDAVSVAASVCMARHQQDELLDLMFIENRAYHFTSGRGLSAAENMMEILACVDPVIDDNFNKLSELVLQHANETSGIVFVFLEWNEIRKNLVRETRIRGIPVMVIVISVPGIIVKNDNDPMTDLPEFFKVLKAGEIEQSLNKMK